MTTNEVIETLKEYSEYCSFKGTYPWNDRIELSMAMAIEALQERMTGKWMPPKKHGCWSYDERAYCSCSICGTAQFLAKRMKYCPNCGAKMEVDE